MEKALKNLLKKVHSDKGIMVYFDTHLGSRELPSPPRGAKEGHELLWGIVC
jgi:hypothetical protein